MYRIRLIDLGTERPFTTLSGGFNVTFWDAIERAMASQYDIDPDEVELHQIEDEASEHEGAEILCARGWPLARIEEMMT